MANEIIVLDTLGTGIDVAFVRPIPSPAVDASGVAFVPTPASELGGVVMARLDVIDPALRAALDAGSAEVEVVRRFVSTSIPLADVLTRARARYAVWVVDRAQRYANQTQLWAFRGRRFDA